MMMMHNIEWSVLEGNICGIHLLPDNKYNPFISTDNDVTASRWATNPLVSLPVLLSNIRMCRSSCAVMVMGMVGCDITFVIAPIEL